MTSRWIPGNRFTLLENGEGFYPRIFEAIRQAEREILIETFILFEDKVGLELQRHLVDAARRGVAVHLLIDGFGSPDLSPGFIRGLTDAGVLLHVFEADTKWLGVRVGWFRRMHRKIAVIDGRRAFVGGINYSADHLGDFGPQAKQDYAVEIEGPLVSRIHLFTRMATKHGSVARRTWRRFVRSKAMPDIPEAGSASAMFVVRDNAHHTTDIERHYRAAIRLAKRRIVIANAYFFPGYRLIRELRSAARRGVEVSLILQGEPDMPIAKYAASMLYDHLMRSGVRVHEYHERPLHGKVAVIDDDWSTVGSSNLDPTSLALNLEANVMIRDRDFNLTLADRLDHLMRHSCREIVADESVRGSRWPALRSAVVFHFLRHFPTWASWLPARRPRITTLARS